MHQRHILRFRENLYFAGPHFIAIKRAQHANEKDIQENSAYEMNTVLTVFAWSLRRNQCQSQADLQIVLKIPKDIVQLLELQIDSNVILSAIIAKLDMSVN